jgi:haloalkane dehalogenase
MNSLTGQAEMPNWLDRNEYPFESNYFNLPMGKMHYVDEGKGEPIVMVHGNPAWSFEFRNVIKEMSKTNRCIAADHIGFGLSDKPADWNYFPAQHATNFERLMDSLDLRDITMVVNDWGGPIGLSYALKYPEKIKKIVILNTWLWSVEDDPHFKKFSGFMGGFLGRFLIRQFNFFGKQVVKNAVGDKKKLTKHIHKHYYLHLEKPGDRKGSYVFPKQIIGSSLWLDSLWKQREKINNIPTTFIWGMKDIAFREQDLNYWLKHWNNSKTIKLAEVGHFPQEEAPEEVIIEPSKK